MDEDDKEFMRAQLRSLDRLIDEFAAGWREMNARMAENFAEVHAEHAAQREALFSIIDRLDNGGAPA